MHIDLCGPIGVESYSGDKYFILFVDDYSRMIILMYLKENSKEFQKFKWYMARVEKKTRKKLKCLRSNRGGEFISNELTKLCTERGIKRFVSTPSTPQYDGIAERRNRSIMDWARNLMIEKNVAIKY